MIRPVKRGFVNKRRSATQFRRNVRKTKSPNAAGPPMRGGWRL